MLASLDLGSCSHSVLVAAGTRWQDGRSNGYRSGATRRDTVAGSFFGSSGSCVGCPGVHIAARALSVESALGGTPPSGSPCRGAPPSSSLFPNTLQMAVSGPSSWLLRPAP